MRFGSTFVILIGTTLAFAAAAGQQAADYPDRPIRLLTPVPPGGLTDVLSRVLAEKLSERFRQPVIVENKAGGAGVNATQIVAKAAPDGYTIVNVSTSHAVQHHLHAHVPYHYLKDFEPVILYARATLAFVVHPSVPVRSIEDFVAYARAGGTSMIYATPGIGSAAHLVMESFRMAADVPLRDVPYKGGAPAVQDVVGGHVPGAMLALSTVAPYVSSGRLRAIFVSSARRSAQFPEVPTLDESGYPGLVKDEWWAILAPAGTPQAIVNRLNAEIARAFESPNVVERTSRIGVEFTGSTPDGAAGFIKSESTRWGKLIKDAHIRAE